MFDIKERVGRERGGGDVKGRLTKYLPPGVRYPYNPTERITTIHYGA